MTTLLELAAELIHRAEEDLTQPIPVVLNLSSYRRSQQELVAWLVDELNGKYQIPRKMGSAWIEGDKLVFLLDGLDETPSEHRAACVEAINRFRREHGLSGLAICSRAEEYEAAATPLQLGTAITLQPLNPEQVSAYLLSTGREGALLQALLRQDAALQELAGSPLMLSVLRSTYLVGVGDLLATLQPLSLELRTRHLFQAYTAQMLRWRGSVSPFTSEQTMRSLTWLAQRMTEASQSVFLIEMMQPGWLRDQRLVWLHRLGVILVTSLPIGVLFGLGVGLPVVWSGAEQAGWLLGILTGLTAALAIVLIVRRIFGIGTSALVGASQAIAFGWPFGLIYGWPDGIAFGSSLAAVFGLAYWFTGRQLSLRGYKTPDEIVIIEKLDWSSRRGAIGAVAGFAGGLAAGLALWSAIRGDDFIKGFGLWFILALGMSAGLVVSTLVGFTGNKIETRVSPNQGIRLSAQNALRVGLALLVAVGFPLGVISGVAWHLALGKYEYWDWGRMSWPVGIVVSVCIGGAFGLAGAWLFGGQACIQHWLLRLLLQRKGDLPWNCVAFLDHMAERIFMRRVGGGYIFIHRLLMEHFAQMTDEEIERIVAGVQ